MVTAQGSYFFKQGQASDTEDESGYPEIDENPEYIITGSDKGTGGNGRVYSPFVKK